MLLVKDCAVTMLRRIRLDMDNDVTNNLLQGSIEGIDHNRRRKVRCYKTCGVFKDGVIYDAAVMGEGVYDYFVWLDSSQYEYFPQTRFGECFSELGTRAVMC